jgi:hypothetical protein
MRHVGRAAGAGRDVPRLRLRERAVDDLPALGGAVTVPVVRVLEREERVADLLHGGVDLTGGDLLIGGRLAGRRGRVAAGDVQVDLQRAARVARLRLADRVGRRSAAIAGLRALQQPEVHQHLARVDGCELRREAVVGRDDRRRVRVAQPLLREPHRRVRALVRAADERPALLDAAVGRPVDLDVVVRRVASAVG